jgi:hypothetical protein
VKTLEAIGRIAGCVALTLALLVWCPLASGIAWLVRHRPHAAVEDSP